MASSSIDTSGAQQRTAERQFAQVIIGTVLVAFGAVMLFFGATYMQDMAMFSALPGAVWDLICGRGLPDGMTAPLLAGIGVLAVLVAVVLMARAARKGRLWVVGFSLTAALLAGSAGYALGHANTAALAQTTSSPVAIMRLDTPRVMPDFTLTGQDGLPVSLSSLRGRVVVMFFGYTHCPDICPTSLSDMKGIKAALGSDANKVAFVFVSVDGDRDTPALMDKYVRAFDPSFIGWTGKPQNVREIALDYGVHFRSNKTGESASYTVDHTADTYVLDAQGRWVAAFGLTAPVDAGADLIHDVINSN